MENFYLLCCILNIISFVYKEDPLLTKRWVFYVKIMETKKCGSRKEEIKRINSWSKNRDYGLFRIYWGMKRRCEYKSQYGYRWYGAKGIKVKWKSYKDFKIDMYESYLSHLKKYGKRETTIDRINNSKNYCKENCRWATWDVQHRTRKN